MALLKTLIRIKTSFKMIQSKTSEKKMTGNDIKRYLNHFVFRYNLFYLFSKAQSWVNRQIVYDSYLLVVRFLFLWLVFQILFSLSNATEQTLSHACMDNKKEVSVLILFEFIS